MSDLSGPERVAPRKRVGGGVLLRDAAGQVLLVEPTYKDEWEIPGGLVEDGESPREAAHRECLEELGVGIDVGALLCVHYCQGSPPSDDGVMFVFDGGTTALGSDELVLPADELRSARFVPTSALDEYVVPAMARRLRAAIDAAAAGQPAYLEH